MTERAIFIAALETNDPAQRSAYLAGACGGDAAQRQRIERLLEAHANAGSFLEEPALSPETADHHPDEPTAPLRSVEGPGMMIGRYKLLQQIGEGGMGIVFMA